MRRPWPTKGCCARRKERLKTVLALKHGSISERDERFMSYPKLPDLLSSSFGPHSVNNRISFDGVKVDLVHLVKRLRISGGIRPLLHMPLWHAQRGRFLQ
jgi:hypothetical protein